MVSKKSWLIFTRQTISETGVIEDVGVDVDVTEDMGMAYSINERLPRPPLLVLSSFSRNQYSIQQGSLGQL